MGGGRHRLRLAAAGIGVVVALLPALLPVAPTSAEDTVEPLAEVAACTRTFDGSAGTGWADPENWTPSGAPGTADVVCVPAGLTASLTTAAHVAAFDVEGRLDVTGSLEIDGPSAAVDLSLLAGSITGTGDLTVAAGGTWTWGEAWIVGTGAMTVEPGATLVWDSSFGRNLGRDLLNRGTIDWRRGGVILRGTGTDVPTLENEGTIDLDLTAGDLRLSTEGTSSLGFFTSSVPDVSQINVANTSGAARAFNLDSAITSIDGLRLTGTGTSFVSRSPLTLTGERLEVGAGTRLVSWGSTTTVSGRIHGGGTLATENVGAMTLTETTTMDLPAVVVDGGVLSTAIDLAPNELRVKSGTLTGTGDLTVPSGGFWEWGESAITGTGSMTVEAGATAVWNEIFNHTIGRNLASDGAITWLGGNSTLDLRGSATGVPTFTNRGTLTVDLTDASKQVTSSGSAARPQIVNEGTIETTSTTAGRVLAVGGNDVQNDGTIAARSGTTIDLVSPVLNLASGALTGGRWEVDDGAALELPGNVTTNAAHLVVRGAGAIRDQSSASALAALHTNTGTVVLEQGADLALAGDLASTGLLSLSSASTLDVFGDLSTTGRLDVELGGATPGTDHSVVEVGDVATLDGTLGFRTVPSYDPGAEQLRIIDAASLSGAFTAVAGASLPDGRGWTTEYRPADGDVLVYAGEGGGGGGEGEDAGAALDAALGALIGVLPAWATHYDLDDVALPIVRPELDTAFGVGDALSGVANDLAGLHGVASEIGDEVLARGCTVDIVDGDDIQVRCIADLGPLSLDSAFGDPFNNATPGLLDGVATGALLAVDPSFDLAADLTATLVIGVDDAGPYVARESALDLDVTGGGPLVGAATVGGLSAVELTDAAASAALGVALATTGAERIRLADLDAAAQTILPALTGTASMGAGAAIGALELSWANVWSAAGAGAAFAEAPTLAAALSVAAIRDAGGATASIALATSQAAGGWLLHGDQLEPLLVAGFPIVDLVVDAALTPTTITGAVAATATLPVWLAAGAATTTAPATGIIDEDGNVTLVVRVNGVDYDLLALADVTLGEIVDHLVALGLDASEIAHILFEHVTDSVVDVMAELQRIGTSTLDAVHAVISASEHLAEPLKDTVRLLFELADADGVAHDLTVDALFAALQLHVFPAAGQLPALLDVLVDGVAAAQTAAAVAIVSLATAVQLTAEAAVDIAAVGAQVLVTGMFTAMGAAADGTARLLETSIDALVDGLEAARTAEGLVAVGLHDVIRYLLEAAQAQLGTTIEETGEQVLALLHAIQVGVSTDPAFIIDHLVDGLDAARTTSGAPLLAATSTVRFVLEAAVAHLGSAPAQKRTHVIALFHAVQHEIAVSTTDIVFIVDVVVDGAAAAGASTIALAEIVRATFEASLIHAASATSAQTVAALVAAMNLATASAGQLTTAIDALVDGLEAARTTSRLAAIALADAVRYLLEATQAQLGSTDAKTREQVLALFHGIQVGVSTDPAFIIDHLVDGMDAARTSTSARTLSVADIVRWTFEAARTHVGTSAANTRTEVLALFHALQHKVAGSTNDLGFIVDNLVDGLDLARTTAGGSTPVLDPATNVRYVLEAAQRHFGSTTARLRVEIGALLHAVQHKIAPEIDDAMFIVNVVVDGAAAALAANGAQILTSAAVIQLTFETALDQAVVPGVAAGVSTLFAATQVTISGAARPLTSSVLMLVDGLEAARVGTTPILTLADAVRWIFESAQSQLGNTPAKTRAHVLALFFGIQNGVSNDAALIIDELVDGLDRASDGVKSILTIANNVRYVFEAAYVHLGSTSSRLRTAVLALVHAVQHKVATSPTNATFILDAVVDGTGAAVTSSGAAILTPAVVVQRTFEGAIIHGAATVAPAVGALYSALLFSASGASMASATAIATVVDGLELADVDLPTIVRRVFEAARTDRGAAATPAIVLDVLRAVQTKVARTVNDLSYLDDVVDGLEQAPGIGPVTVVLHVFDGARVVMTSVEDVDIVRGLFAALRQRVTSDPVIVIRDLMEGVESSADFSLTQTVTAVYIAAASVMGFEDLVYTMVEAIDVRIDDDIDRIFTAMWNGLDPESGKGEKTILRAIVAAADVLTVATFSTMAVVMEGLDGISYAEMVDAFDVGADASVSAIADALHATTATSKEIMRALEDELDVTRFDTAEQLRRLGYGINTIIEALIDVYDASYDSVFEVLQHIGYSAGEILAVICDHFPC